MGMESEETVKLGKEDLTPTAYIRKVGRGKTLAKSLGNREARQAFDWLFAGRFTDSQVGAFLQALRIKELEQDELDALWESLMSKTGPFLSLQPALIPGLTLNLASDTARKGGYVSLLAASLLATDGISLGVLRSDPILSKNSHSWVLSKELSGELLNGIIQEGIGQEQTHSPTFPIQELRVEDWIPALLALRRIREELGFRSCLHTAEKMLNPWPAQPLVLGISHRHYAERMALTLQRFNQKGFIVLGNHGTPDLALHKETEFWEISPEIGIRKGVIHPSDFGLEPDSILYTLGFFGKWSEELKKPEYGLLGPAILYHLAFFRYVLGNASTPRQGLDGYRGPKGLSPLLNRFNQLHSIPSKGTV